VWCCRAARLENHRVYERTAAQRTVAQGSGALDVCERRRRHASGSCQQTFFAAGRGDLDSHPGSTKIGGDTAQLFAGFFPLAFGC